MRFAHDHPALAPCGPHAAPVLLFVRGKGHTRVIYMEVGARSRHLMGNAIRTRPLSHAHCPRPCTSCTWSRTVSRPRSIWPCRQRSPRASCLCRLMWFAPPATGAVHQAGRKQYGAMPCTAQLDASVHHHAAPHMLTHPRKIYCCCSCRCWVVPPHRSNGG